MLKQGFIDKPLTFDVGLIIDIRLYDYIVYLWFDTTQVFIPVCSPNTCKGVLRCFYPNVKYLPSA